MEGTVGAVCPRVHMSKVVASDKWQLEHTAESSSAASVARIPLLTGHALV